MQEIWKDVKGYEGLYQVSNFGNVKSIERDSDFYSGLTNDYQKRKIRSKILSTNVSKSGYLQVCLTQNSRYKTYTIHRLVAETFIPNVGNKLQVNHKDGNKFNNCVTNLEWCTARENMKHAAKNGLLKPKKVSVIQYDIDGNYIKKWETIRDFLIKNGKDTRSSLITACCKGRKKTAYGYKWKYAD